MARPGTPQTIEIRLRSVAQLFNSLDPSPFIEKDLDADAEQFIEGWAAEKPRNAPLRLVLHLETLPASEEEMHAVGEAVRHYFAYRADRVRSDLRRLLALGRLSMLIGVLFVAACIAVAQAISANWEGTLAEIVEQSFVIVGWVAMWRPLEVFLYDWWPLVRRARLYDRLASMRVECAGSGAVTRAS